MQEIDALDDLDGEPIQADLVVRSDTNGTNDTAIIISSFFALPFDHHARLSPDFLRWSKLEAVIFDYRRT